MNSLEAKARKKPFLKCKYKSLRIISDKAIVVECYNGDSAVLPKSQIRQNLFDDSVLVPVWLAEQKTLQFSSKRIWLADAMDYNHLMVSRFA